MTHLNQVGQTGATRGTPRGWRRAVTGRAARGGLALHQRARAVNLDPNCGWARGKADVVYVADAFAVMAKVNALLAEQASK